MLAEIGEPKRVLFTSSDALAFEQRAGKAQVRSPRSSLLRCEAAPERATQYAHCSGARARWLAAKCVYGGGETGDVAGGAFLRNDAAATAAVNQWNGTTQSFRRLVEIFARYGQTNLFYQGSHGRLLISVARLA